MSRKLYLRNATRGFDKIMLNFLMPMRIHPGPGYEKKMLTYHYEKSLRGVEDVEFLIAN